MRRTYSSVRPANHPQLALCLEVGSSTSAVGVLYHSSSSESPLVGCVDQWPGQETAIYLEHVPTVLMYDSNGQVRFEYCGGNAFSHDATERVEEDGWRRIEHFKMHLLVDTPVWTGQHELLDLPSDISLNVIYRDWLIYLLAQTQRYLEQRAGVGPDHWAALLPIADFLMTHPNRWGTSQQAFLQQAAIDAGIVSPDDVYTRLKFAEESEAAACYCMPNCNVLPKVGTRFIICDAGGSTVDVSGYELTKLKNGIQYLQELDVPSSLDAGGVSVDKYFRAHLHDVLMALPQQEDDRLPERLEEGVRNFEGSAKRRFTDVAMTYDVNLGDRRLTVPEYGIKRGTLKLEGITARMFFDSSVNQIKDSISSYFSARKKPEFLILTGGLGQSGYIKRELERAYSPKHILASNPTTGKAVAYGGLHLLTGHKLLFKIDRKPRKWKTLIGDFFNRFLP